MKVEELDSVRLKNGVEGVVLVAPSDSPYFLFEYKTEDDEEEYKWIDVPYEDIEEVTWRFSEHRSKSSAKEKVEE